MKYGHGLTVLALLALTTGSALADGAQTGTIDGRVLDAQGQALPGATVLLSGPRGEKAATSDADGAFRFGLLPSGEYTVTARLEGLGEAASPVPLEAGARRTIELELRADTAEIITVTAEAALVDRYAMGSSAKLENDLAEEVSFRNRHYQSSLEALPGVVNVAASRAQGDIGFAANGGERNEVAGFVDGVDTSFARFNGSPRLFLPTTSLEQVGLDSAGFSTEYGRVVGGIASAVVKSGTNDFHGNFLYVPQNQKWRAAYETLEIPREDSIIDSFEANVGGPMVRDRAWFFGSYAELDTNTIDRFPAGAPVNVGFMTEAKLLKLTLQPGDRHHLAILGVDTPVAKTHIEVNSGDQYTPCACNLEGDMLTATWGYSITPSLFLEAKVADQENAVLRDIYLSHPLVPGANPDSPPGNNFSYQDRASGLFHNTIGQEVGTGYEIIPRSQANVSLSSFRGSHELKFGVDYQDIESQTFNQIGKRYRGNQFNENLPGGFGVPQFVDVYDPSQEIVSTSEIVSGYVQDRWDLGDRWNLYAGLRVDDQTQHNDVGQEVTSYTKLAPRLAAVYDLRGTGRFLLKGAVGRYFQTVYQDLVNVEFARQPNGTNLFTRFNWNPVTQRYDVFAQRFVPAFGTSIQSVDPYYKDEATAGIEWQFLDAWVLETQAIWWELEDLFWASDQFDATGRAHRDIRNWDDGFREYEGLRFELNRAFRTGWTLRTNYTLGEGKGNNYGARENVLLHDDDLFEALGGVEVGTGRTDATIIGREGRGPLDRTHVLNVIGLRQLRVGVHTVGLGGYFTFQSGERWGRRTGTQIVHPVSGLSIPSSTYREPRDSHQLEDTFSLNLTTTWSFPLGSRLEGRVAIEASNVTNEQETIGINRANGLPLPGIVGIQSPREVRGQLGIEF